MALGDFERLEVLGRGSFGTVYRSVQPFTNRPVALKVLDQVPDLSDVDRLRFERECRALAAVEHPNIVRVFDAGIDEGVPYLAMELAARGPLPCSMPLDPPTAVWLFVDVCAAVEALHSRGILHRDLKPGNFLVTADGRLKVGDLGLAVLSGEVGATLAGSTTNLPIGTLPYMAPELFDGKPASQASDVYALGACLYEMVTGSPPFLEPGVGVAQLLRRVFMDEPALLDRLGSLDASVVASCLAKDPTERPSAAELHAHVKAAADRDLVAPPTHTEPAQQTCDWFWDRWEVEFPEAQDYWPHLYSEQHLAYAGLWPDGADLNEALSLAAFWGQSDLLEAIVLLRFNAGRVLDAEYWARRWNGCNPDSATDIDFIHIYMAMGQWELVERHALAELSRGEASPLHPLGLRYAIGLSYWWRRDLERAEKWLQASVAKAASDGQDLDLSVRPFILLAIIRHILGDVEGAIEWIEYVLDPELFDGFAGDRGVTDEDLLQAGLWELLRHWQFERHHTDDKYEYWNWDDAWLNTVHSEPTQPGCRFRVQARKWPVHIVLGFFSEFAVREDEEFFWMWEYGDDCLGHRGDVEEGWRWFDAGHIEGAVSCWEQAADEEDEEAQLLLHWLVSEYADVLDEHPELVAYSGDAGDFDVDGLLPALFDVSSRSEWWLRYAAEKGDRDAAERLHATLKRTNRYLEARAVAEEFGLRTY